MTGIKKAVFVDFKDSVSKARTKIEKDKRSVVVLKDKKYFGALDGRQIREHPVRDPSNTYCGSIAAKAPRIYETDGVYNWAQAFFSVRFDDLAVVDKHENVLGVISRYDALKQANIEKKLPKKRVSEIMTSPVITITEKATINDATTIMRKQGVRRLVVINETGLLKGLLSSSDIGLKLVQPTERLPFMTSEKAKPWEQPIGPLIKKDVEIISPNKTILEAAEKMVEKKVPSLIVCEGKTPVGLISTKDIFRSILTSKKGEIDIYISGLDRYDKPFYGEIKRECERVIKKLARYVKVSSLSMHVKKYGNRYSVRARLEIGKKVIQAKGTEWSLPQAIADALTDLRRKVEKKKTSPLHTLHHVKKR